MGVMDKLSYDQLKSTDGKQRTKKQAWKTKEPGRLINKSSSTGGGTEATNTGKWEKVATRTTRLLYFSDQL